MEQSSVFTQISALFLQIDPLMMAYAHVIADRAVLYTLRPGETLQASAGNLRQSAYVMEGVIRVYYVDKNQDETTVQLLAEGGIIPRTNGYQEILADHTHKYDALTEVLLAIWDQEALDFFIQNVPNWLQFSMKMSSYVFLKAAAERDEMFKDDATTRYRKFVERHPSIVERVQLRYVADYLGIAPQSLSRIRQQIFQQGKIN